jgi:hypothetical protein
LVYKNVHLNGGFCERPLKKSNFSSRRHAQGSGRSDYKSGGRFLFFSCLGSLGTPDLKHRRILKAPWLLVLRNFVTNQII